MDQKELLLVLKMQDEASKQIKTLGDTLKNVDKSTGKASTSFGNFVKSAAGAVAALVSIRAVVGFAKDSFDEFIGSQQTATIANQALQNAFDNLTEGQVQNLKKELGTTTVALTQIQEQMKKTGEAALQLGYDDDDATLAFSRLFQITGDVTKATNDVSLAMDLAAFSGKSLEEATQAIVQVHAGSTRVLKEFGIQIDANADSTKALEELNTRVTGSAEKLSQTVGGQIDILKNKYANLKEGVGELLTQLLSQTGIMDGLSRAVEVATDAIKNHDKYIQQAKDTVKGWIQTLEDQTGVVTILKTAWNDIVTVFNEHLKPALAELWEALKPLQPFLELLAKIIGVILYGAFIALVKLLEVSVIATIELLTGAVRGAIDFVNKFKEGWDAVTDTLAKVVGWFDKVIEKIKQLNVVQGAKNAISNALGFISGGKASGGPVSAGNTYLVGENGPEFFTPTASGNIIPNGSKVGGGVTVIVNGDVTGTELVERVKEAIMQQLSMNMRIA